ncbi:MAG: alpha-keto acid decarboxylase family protein [Planctomycetes bacterium]|nr:alpha-keto acid decarboxylase family protein [Planctomycetota bacterium]
MARASTVGGYLVQRLEEAGLRHVFGIPGDYVLRFYDLLEASRMGVVGTCSEAGAAFAADAYARVNGLGAICITYCVGGLNTINAVAEAYAEKSPVIVISGAPGLRERVRSPLLHHRVRDFNTQKLIFEQVTVASACLEDAARAGQQIDEAIAACHRHKRPVYLELPRDMVDQPCAAPAPLAAQPERSDPAALREALAEAAAMVRAARRPVILAGVELHRFGLQETLVRLVERTGYPVAATLLGKSVISEIHPQYLGIYEGGMGRDDVRRAVEGADAVLILGAFLTDIDLGVFTAHLDVGRAIHATSERIAIRHHHFEDITLRDFLHGLLRAPIGPRRRVAVAPKQPPRPFRIQRNRRVTVRRFFARLNDFLEDNFAVVCDPGDSLFGAADLTIHRKTEFLSPAYYTSMGFAVPAALGAQIGKRRLRPIVLVGDGAFQMTGQELSTIARFGLNPIVIVLNNKGYTTERYINDGPYNDIPNWSYHEMPRLLGAGWGCEVRTEGDLEAALARARANTRSFSLINLHLDPYDRSEALKRLGRSLGRQIR